MEKNLEEGDSDCLGDGERTAKEMDDEIKRKKERQVTLQCMSRIL